MRLEFELSAEELKKLLKAMTPQPVMYGTGGMPLFTSRQDNANRAWETLGKKRGFKPMTVRPVPGKDQRYFTAEIVE